MIPKQVGLRAESTGVVAALEWDRAGPWVTLRGLSRSSGATRANQDRRYKQPNPRLYSLEKDMNDENAAKMEMPRYRSHKEVWALKIADIQHDHEGSTITPTNKEYAPFRVDTAYVDKHRPRIGGYYVVYADGYKSWSPPEAFEEGYTLIENYWLK